MFSSLFEGIVNCDNDHNSRAPNQFSVEYSYTQNPVKLGDKTYLTITVKDKSSGNPVSDANVKLAIGRTSPLFGTDSLAMAFASAGAAAATTSPTQETEDKITQLMHTDKNGRATFTVQVGPESDIGTYDPEIEVTKDTYLSIFEQTDLRVT
jgi:5-hydroxyisourate hydrolase-like protein (transthyretin family)